MQALQTRKILELLGALMLVIYAAMVMVNMFVLDWHMLYLNLAMRTMHALIAIHLAKRIA